ncbi:UbiD family decarboxylase [Candidatus Bathyarchaeota archaeon]|nr:UbiD family decarboxylase [Candidatus Bathyarchaeota archaeon]
MTGGGFDLKNLRTFLDEINEEIVTIDEPLSRIYEIAATLKQFDGGKAVIVREEETGIRVVGGVNGSRNRLLRSIGVTQENLYPTLVEATKNPLKCKEGDGPVKEVVEEGNLNKVPVLTHFKGDPGPYITSGILYAKDPEGIHENVSFHRLLVLDEKRMVIRIVPRHLYRITQLAREKGIQSLDVAITIGHHPVTLLSAALPAGYGVSEFDVANRLLGDSLKLTQCEHVDALAPADAELVLEGKLRLDKNSTEGPFVDLSGTFDVQRQQPVVELVGVMHRENYIYQGLLPSGSEHRLLMGMPREPRIWEYVRNVVPNVRGVNMTVGGMGWLHCVVSFEKFREGDPKNVLMAIFAAHPSLKHAVVVDSDIDPYDMEQVEWAIATRFKGDEDILLVPNVRVSSLDPAGDQDKELGCKVGIDGTRPMFKDIAGFKRAEIPVSDRVKKILDKHT